MPEENKNKSIEKSLAGTLTSEAEKHPMFRTQSEKDKLDFVFDKLPLVDTEDIRNGNTKELQG